MRLILEINTSEQSELLEALSIIEKLLGKTPNVETTVTKPKKKARSVTEKVVEAPKETSEGKSSPEPKNEAQSSITLQVLKDSARSCVARTDRVQVKTCISKYAPKLSEVQESDFGKLYKELQSLGK